MTFGTTVMEFGWNFVDVPMSNPADLRVSIGSDTSLSTVDPNDPSGGYHLQYDSKADVLGMLRGGCTLRAVMSSDNLDAAVLDKMLLVTLDGTSFNPRPSPPAIPDGPQRLNWFIDRVDIEIGFDDRAPAGLERISDVPLTSSLRGQTQSSISTTLQVGFFGDSVNASYSRSWSHSFGIQLEDFALTRNSVGNQVRQSLCMEMSKSAAYARPEDLIDGDAEWPAMNPPSTLYSPPDAAMTNLDIPTQCVFRVPGTENGTFNFRIRMVPRFVMLRARRKNFSEESPAMQGYLKRLLLGDGIFFGASADPARYYGSGFPHNTMMDIEMHLPEFVWDISVDFSKVRAS